MTPERITKLRAALRCRQLDLTVLMEGVHKVHNLAAIGRSSEAVGVHRIHAVSDKPIKLTQDAACGVGKFLKVVTHKTVQEGVAELKSQGFAIYAAHMAEDGLDYRDLDCTQPLALMMGSELKGVSEEALALCDGSVHIPMLGVVGSLNVSVAAALLLFEAKSQRRRAGMYETQKISDEEHDRLLFEWAYPRVADSYRRKKLPYPPLDEDGDLIIEKRVLS